jgi:protein TonB
MIQIRDNVPAVSANDLFKSQYNRSLRAAGVAAVLLSALMVWFSPRYAPQPYRLRNEAMTITDIEVEIIIEEPPEVAAAPQLIPEIEPALEDDPNALDTIEIRDFDDYFMPDVTTTPAAGEGFVASSTKPQLISRPKPHYPEVARLAQVEGTVVVKVLVDVDGQVAAAEIVRGVHPLLNNAALKAARGCLFVPGQQRELKVATWVAVPYNFRLR